MAIKKPSNKIDITNIRDKGFKQKLFYSILKFAWMIGPGVTEKLVLRLFFAPMEYRLNQSEKSLLSQAQSFNIKVNHKNIMCLKWGQGPVIVFAHGWNGRGIQFQPLIESLVQQNYSVVTYDAPGHGDSEGKTSNYFEFTDTLRTLMQSLQNEEVVAVIGHSLGAGAVINYADKEQYNKKIILIAPALKLRELLFKSFEQYNIPKIVYLNLVQNLEFVHGYNIFLDNPIQLIGNLKNEILILHDENDKAAPYSDTQLAAELSEKITLHTTVGLGHKRILTDKSTMNSILTYLKDKKNISGHIQKAS